MKIDNNVQIGIQFPTSDAFTRQTEALFESYLRKAILEIEQSEFLRKSERETLRFLTEQISASLDLLERISRTTIDSSSSSTIGDFLLTQALELEKIANSLPEGALKNLFKESALYIGIEAEKIRRGYYAS